MDRFYPSSKTCSACGYKMDDLPLSIRAWTCPVCGAAHDRDHNAAINIQKQGLLKLKAEGLSVSACGGCVSHCENNATANETRSPYLQVGE